MTIVVEVDIIATKRGMWVGCPLSANQKAIMVVVVVGVGVVVVVVVVMPSPLWKGTIMWCREREVVMMMMMMMMMMEASLL